jgi:hypothetical protein
MKKRFEYLIIVFIAMLSSCNKDEIINTHDKVGISKVTYYANITLTGGTTVSIVKGTNFTDPGVKAEAGGTDVPVTTTGTVDKDQVGIYTLNYSATNPDGFTSSATRTVVVIPSAEVPGVDISGEYADPTGGTGNAQITKLAPGVYFTTNCWGNGSLAIIPATFICTDGATLLIPLQDGSAGHIETTMPGTYVGGLITWEIVRLDFPGGALTRTKTWQKL